MTDQSPLTIPEDLLARVRNARHASVLTGAGVSADSGVPTFRGAEGVWEKYDYRKLATPAGFRDDPCLVWEWYQMRQRGIERSRPNPAHAVIVEMERHFDSFAVITQNIDGLHRRAGNRHVIELHGNIWRMRCTRDGAVVDIDAPVEDIPPMCRCGGMMRPDVVWFGEQLPSDAIEQATKAAHESEVMFVIGTSAVVYPAAALPALTKSSGGAVIEFNLEPTDVTAYADASFFGRAGEVLPGFWKQAMSFPKGL